MALTTTTIGAFPKPDYVPVSDWFALPQEGEAVALTERYAAELAAAGDAAEALFARATHAAIRDQVEAGIDIPTDGEMRRENYIHYHCRHLNGIDFDRLTDHAMRGNYRVRVPTITGPISATAPFLPHDWRVAQAATSRPVKVTLPGPMTIADSLADQYYGDATALAADISVALNAEIRALAEAGCTHIQVDEPVFARQVTPALDYGVENLAHCFHGLPESVTRITHVCLGYPDGIDRDNYPKAPGRAYLQLANALNAAPLDQISIEDAHCHNDLAALLPHFKDSVVILGVVAIAASRIEPVPEISQRIRLALKHIEADRLVIAPDCGLGFLGRGLALKKLRNMTEAARLLA